ncbi:hypothetical protein GSI_00300 [Ganoderma sinense ZZ0214-1]|uniref:Uncharacterized protein n=1 Tax=Ganoderma sinense ZZ0214-1 TaxID=1077348 RepID=A0A2G8SS47_9APHY|nr:hypothetical protein GSI_00300 [Ganoderma sinense ZZ0214-1]
MSPAAYCADRFHWIGIAQISCTSSVASGYAHPMCRGSVVISGEDWAAGVIVESDAVSEAFKYKSGIDESGFQVASTKTARTVKVPDAILPNGRSGVTVATSQLTTSHPSVSSESGSRRSSTEYAMTRPSIAAQDHDGALYASGRA